MQKKTHSAKASVEAPTFHDPAVGTSQRPFASFSTEGLSQTAELHFQGCVPVALHTALMALALP